MNDLLEKEYKRNRKGMIAGIVLLSIASLLLIVSLIKTINIKSNALHLNDAIIMEEGRKEGRLSYLDSVGFYQFASYGDDLGYYIAYDEDYMYIISIKEKDFDYFADQFDDKDTVRIWGYTRKIPEEAKPYAISAVNEDTGEELITASNFVGYCLCVEKQIITQLKNSSLLLIQFTKKRVETTDQFLFVDRFRYKRFKFISNSSLDINNQV